MRDVDLRGASADSLVALRERVEETGDAADGLGEELFAVAALLRAQPSLRRVVTDASTDADAKADLMRSVLGGKVSEAALDVVAAAAARRWTRPRDLADVLEELGVVAVVRASGDDVGRLVDDLFSVRRVVDTQPELRTALGDPARSVGDKDNLVQQLFADRTTTAAMTLTRQALVGSHRTVSLALEAFEQVAAQVRGQRVATVRTAAPLSDSEQERLRAALSQNYGREVHLDVVVDGSLLGGVRVEIGDDVIDGSVAARLAEAHRLIAG